MDSKLKKLKSLRDSVSQSESNGSSERLGAEEGIRSKRSDAEDDLHTSHERRTQALHEQTMRFRKSVKSHAYGILYGELMFLVLLIICQGFSLFKFHLNDWVINTVSGGCILQSFFTIQTIVKSVFPNNLRK